MTTWGAYSTNVYAGDVTNTRVGIDVHTDAINAGTTAVNVYVDVYVGSYNYDYGDNQHIDLSGSVGAAFDFRNDLPRAPGATKYIGRAIIGGQGQSYGGGPQYYFKAQLSGAFNGAAPWVETWFTLPARPIRPPSQTYPPYANSIGATTASIGWGAPDDHGGSGLDYSWLQVGKTNFGNLIYDNQSPGWNGRNLGGLAPATTYFMRAAAHNAAGWGAWSGVSSFLTGVYQPPAPTFSAINPDNLTVGLTKPNDAAAPTNFHLQWSRNSNFATVDGEVTAAWASSYRVTGLLPATTYSFRTQANPGTGWGYYSATTTATTLSGAKVLVNGQWVNAVAYVRSGGTWVLAKVYKRANGAWVI